MSSHAKQSKADVVTDFRRSQLIAAARERFGRHGLAGITVDGIARSAGVAKGTVYLYFKSKEEILGEILDEDVRRFRQDTVPIITGPDALEDHLRRYLVNSLNFFDLKRDFFEQVQFDMGPEVRRKAQKKIEAVFRAQVDAWEHALTGAHQQGLLGVIAIPETALTIVATANGLAKHRLRGWASGSAEEMAAQASLALWRGLAAR